MAQQFELAEAYTELTIRDTKFKRMLGTVHTQLKGLQANFDKVAVHARRMLLVGTGAIVGFIKAASDAEEIAGKFNAVFKDNAKEVNEWATTHASAVGRSRFALQGYLSTLQDTFVPLGFAREEGARLSKQLTTLAIDLASFNNASEPETVMLLTSALVGNHEAVRRFGIVMTEATLKQELMNMGIRGGTKDATLQQKVMARLNIIMRSTTDAQGDATRTAGSMANQFRALRAEAFDLAVEIGQSLMPAGKGLVNWLREAIGPMGQLTDATKKNILSWSLFGSSLLGALAIAPQVIGAIASMTVALQRLGASGGAILLAHGAVGLLVVGLALLAAAWLDAKAKGISFRESLAELTLTILGMRTAVDDLADAQERERASRGLSGATDKAVATGDLGEMEKALKSLYTQSEAVVKSIGRIKAQVAERDTRDTWIFGEEGWLSEGEETTLQQLELLLKQLMLRRDRLRKEMETTPLTHPPLTGRLRLESGAEMRARGAEDVAFNLERRRRFAAINRPAGAPPIPFDPARARSDELERQEMEFGRGMQATQDRLEAARKTATERRSAIGERFAEIRAERLEKKPGFTTSGFAGLQNMMQQKVTRGEAELIKLAKAEKKELEQVNENLKEAIAKEGVAVFN